MTLRASSAGGIAVAALLGAGLAVELGLHFLEPRLAITWSYAHLWRSPALPWVGAALVLVLPAATLLAWRHPAVARPPGTPSWPAVLGVGVVLGAGLVVVGHRWPAASISVDPAALVMDVAALSLGNGRRLLLVWSLGHLWHLGTSWWPNVSNFIRGVNALFGAASLLLLGGCARRLARTRGETAAIALLAWTAFGTFQLCIGYLEVYPAELLATTLYLWLALQTIDGELHPAWPVVVAALAPFWYVTLVLLAPSLVVIAVVELRRPRGLGRLALSAILALAAAGAATLPFLGRPFAWATLAARVSEQSGRQFGLSPTSSLLPFAYIVSGYHARELVHTLLLVDGVGVLLLLAAGPWVLAQGATDAKAVFLALVIASHLPYFIAFDPVWGALCDWDLFSYLAAPTSLLGAWVFVQWGRRWPDAFALLLGLALATAGVHLLARLNALEIDLPRHRIESPYHEPAVTQLAPAAH